MLLSWLQVFFAVLLVGVSIGQALPHVQRLVVAETAIRRLNIIISRVLLFILHTRSSACLHGCHDTIIYVN